MRGSLWSTPLVGRDSELALLEAYRRRTSRGFAALLLVADPGMGKSRLAAEFLARHKGRVAALTARAAPLGATVPFGVWSEALEQHFRLLDRAQVTDLCEGYLDDLSALVRSVALARGGAPGRDPPPMRLMAGLAGVIARMASRRPVVAVLDDMHAADASSWEALGYLARALSATPVLVVCIARPGELSGHAAGAAVALSLEQDGLLERLPLGPLRPEALSAIAADVLGEEPRGALPRWLGERSQGNPLYALSLLQGLLDEEADLSAPELRSLPQHLADRITGRLRGLTEPALRVLELVAVAGGRSELGSLLQLTGRPVEELAVVLETLVRSRWLLEEERGSGVTFEIPHPLITEALYQTIGAARRRVLHRQVARFLADEGVLAAAAPHFARSAEARDPEAVEALCDAVRQAEARGAYGEGLAILDALVDLLPAGDPRWHEVVQALSWRAEWVVDHRADVHAELGIRAMRRMDAVLEGVDAPAARAAVKFRLASFLAWGTGELEEAERVCDQARRLYMDTDDVSGTLLSANELAWIRGLRAGMAVLAEEAARVAEAAETAGERFALLQALGAMGAAAGFQGNFELGDGLWLRTLDLATEDGKPYRGTVARLSLAVTRSISGRVREALVLMDEARADPRWRESPLPEWESMIRWAAGDFPAAVAAAEEALAATSGRPSRRRAIGVSFAALSAIEADMLPQADRLLGLASAAYDERDWSCYRDVVRYAQGVLRWRRGDAAGALAELHGAADHMAAMDARVPLGFVLFDAAQVAAESGAADASLRAAASLADVASTVGFELCRALAAIAAAWASVSSGDPDRAVAMAEEALGHLQGLELPFWTGRANEVLGRAYGVCNPPAAVAAYRSAAEAYEHCGALWRRSGAVDAMRALGGEGRRAAAAVLGAGSLTRREREVARLACQGRTAREIAEHLSIAERTVEGHIANVYAKLGISSKLELVRRQAELRL